MEPFLLALIGIGLLFVLVFIIYLVDRVNSIEKETRRVAQSLNDAKDPPPWARLPGFPPKNSGMP